MKHLKSLRFLAATCLLVGLCNASLDLTGNGLRVHQPPHITALPEEVVQTQIPSLTIGQDLHSALDFDMSEELSSLLGERHILGEDEQVTTQHWRSNGSHPNRNPTLRAAVEAAGTLDRQLLDVQHHISRLEQISSQTVSGLISREKAARSLHAELVQKAHEQSEQAARCADEISGLTGRKAAATAALDLEEAARVQAKLARKWAHLTALHGYVAQNMEDADSLAEVALSLRLAQSQEEANLGHALTTLADAAEEAARRLQVQAANLRAAGQQRQAAADATQRRAASEGSEVAVRLALGDLDAEALQVLTRSEEQLARARSHFQEVWRHELVAAQQHALQDALISAAANQEGDLQKRRDMALAVDAYPEALATQRALSGLQSLHTSLQPSASATAAHADVIIESSGTTTITTATTVTTISEELQQALEAYRSRLAAQREASALLGGLYNLREQLLAGKVTAAQALQGLGQLNAAVQTAAVLR